MEVLCFCAHAVKTANIIGWTALFMVVLLAFIQHNRIMRQLMQEEEADELREQIKEYDDYRETKAKFEAMTGSI